MQNSLKVNILLPTACLTIVFLLGACASSSAETARGVVFDDRNGNGVRESGEPGLAGVRVSNGLDIVATDADGRYELAVDDDTIVMMLKPRGWKTASDKRHLQRFYYIHKPAGSPDKGFKYPGVAPTGPLPESIDFPLTSSPEPDKFTMILMGDPQPGTRQQVRFYANDVLAELIDTSAAFGISMGDIVGDDLSLFGPVNAVQGLIGVPWYNVLGNHDMNYRSPNDQYSDETFERIYGPANYAFQYGPVHFLVLDNVYWKGPRREDAQKNTLGGYEGRFNDRQLQFIANYLSAVPQTERVVLCVHIPLPDFGARESTAGLHKLLKILSSHPHTLSFSAHTHINGHRFLGKDAGYSHKHGDGHHHHHNVATASGSWYRGPLDEQGFPVTTMADGAPNGYILATFDGPNYSLRYKAARMPAGYQIALTVPDVIQAKQSDAVEVVANVFNGNEKSQVRMRVRGHGDWQRMKQSPRKAPAYVKAQARDRKQAGGRRSILPGARKTSHIWAAPLPPNVPVGFHVLEVESTDMFGTVDRAVRLIDVQ